MTLSAQSGATIGAILLTMAVVAWIETIIPLHLGARGSRAHLRPNLALTFITFGTNVFLNAALGATLVLLSGLGFGVLNWFPLAPVTALAVTLLVLDFSFYVAHVAMHKVPATRPAVDRLDETPIREGWWQIGGRSHQSLKATAADR